MLPAAAPAAGAVAVPPPERVLRPASARPCVARPSATSSRARTTRLIVLFFLLRPEIIPRYVPAAPPLCFATSTAEKSPPARSNLPGPVGREFLPALPPNSPKVPVPLRCIRRCALKTTPLPRPAPLCSVEMPDPLYLPASRFAPGSGNRMGQYPPAGPAIRTPASVYPRPDTNRTTVPARRHI